MSNYIQTFSGVEFDLSDVRPEMVSIKDIAHGLANTCRFGGHCKEFYSVAQHSIIASALAPPEHAFAALLHDAAEAYLGDIPSPLKRLLPDYRALEKRVEAVIFERFGIPYPLPGAVKYADLQALALERRFLLTKSSGAWPMLVGVEVPSGVILPESPERAKARFLDRFLELVGGVAYA